MALIWAWNPDIAGPCNCESSSDAGWAPMYQQGWRWGSTHSTYTVTDIISHSCQPVVGYGGSSYALQVQGGNYFSYYYYCYITSPANCWPAIDDGIIQFRLYASHVDSTYPVITLYAPNGTEVFHLHLSGLKLLARYNKSGVGMTTGLTTDAEIALHTWTTISIRLKNHASLGEIEISINGMPAESSGVLAMGHALEWNKFRLWSHNYGNTYRRYTHFSVYDNPASDDALETIKWTCVLRPSSDVQDGSWEDPGGLTDNLYEEVDDVTFTTATYCTTITSADEVRWGVETDDINAAWAPATIDGVVVSAAMRGDGSLYQGQAVLSADRSLTGTAAFTASNTTVTGTGTDFDPEVQAGDFVKLDADGEEAWTQVETVNSDTSLTLVTGGYLGSTGSGAISAKAMGALTATTLLPKYVDPVVRTTVPGTSTPWTTSTIDTVELGVKVRKIT